jgi:hypothetical protein
MMRERNTTNRVLMIAGLATLAAAATGCARSLQFSGALHYGNLMAEPTADDATEAAKAQLLSLAESYGLEVRQAGKDTMHFVARAPAFTVTQPDGAVEERADTRVVHVKAQFGEELGRNAYRYYCWVEGVEPAAFTDDDRARFGLALLAVREIFEKPIATDFLGG